MASVSLSHIYKVYPNGLKAVNDFSMDIADREFIVFVGPSGCGKSTTLRMIAGLEDITAGELRIGGEVVNFTEPKDRDIAMVFQNYALYPHMSVFDNMAFGLQLRHYPKDEIRRRVNEAARILGITDYLGKKPKEMSGGQRQRVALGRAIVREPKVFLLDEPLSNLDAKLRTQMRSEILKLHERIKTTFIYVTHDQVEAMTMGTRIVVMKDGYVQQIDTPRNLYSYPANKFVAGFIGTPQMNFYSGTIKRDGDGVDISFDGTGVRFAAPYKMFAKTDWMYLGGDKPVIFGIRSEHISVDPKKYPYKAKARVSYCEDLGVDSQVYADFNLAETDEEYVGGSGQPRAEDGLFESPTKAVIKAPAATMYEKGEIIDVSLDLTAMCIFDADSEVSVLPRCPQYTAFGGTVKDGQLEILGAKFAVPSAIPLDDGEYVVEASADALSFGGSIKVKVEDSEKIGDTSLVCVTSCDSVLYVRAAENQKTEKTVGLDLKLCNFYKKKTEEQIREELVLHKAEEAREAQTSVRTEKKVNGFLKFCGKVFKRGKKNKVHIPEPPKAHVRNNPRYACVVQAMNLQNTLDCSFVRYKEKEEKEIDGETKTVSVKKYSLKFLNPDIPVPTAQAEGSLSPDDIAVEQGSAGGKSAVPTFEIKTDDDIAQKITTGAGRLVYKDVLQVVFSPYDAKFSDSGLNAVVTDIADYGEEKFCVCDVNGTTVFVADDGRAAGDAVKILPNITSARIYDKTIDIRLV